MDPCSKTPHRSDNQEKIDTNERPTLFCIFDEYLMEMHVILGAEIVIESSVDILKMMYASMLIWFPSFWVRSMEMTASRCI